MVPSAASDLLLHRGQQYVRCPRRGTASGTGALKKRGEKRKRLMAPLGIEPKTVALLEQRSTNCSLLSNSEL